MNIKKVFVVGTAGFVAVCLVLFYVLNSSLTLRQSSRLDYGTVKSKLEQFQQAVKSHKNSLDDLLEAVNDQHINFKKNHELEDNIVPSLDKHSSDRKAVASSSSLSCSAAYKLGPTASSDIDMLNVYEDLPFDDPDGGVWKQGWNVQVNMSRFSSESKLKVFVIPHSHNDPGWIKTFEDYFETQTKHILNSMLEKLRSDSSLKFIWAEISYFSMWWDNISDQDKADVKRLVDNKQLEFVTGGWVMPDEANSHYFGMLTQMIEGHQWLLHHLNFVPKNGWSIDPFGMSPTNAYLLRRTGLSNMLIQRTHYAVKKYLARRQDLEFRWRQNWDSKGSADMLCHMMPFYSYDVPHTCGPDPSICCQFDFKRMRSVSPMTCPWRKPVQAIQLRNVKERSLTLLDQYRKKAMLYKTNVLLVPLGDDFRWEDLKEWDAQTVNYDKIFNYINSNEDLLAEVRFGTLDDYFHALEQEIQTKKFKPNVLSGDFFTYADRSDHYWSGYFTSRPFHKAMDRQLITATKAAQAAFTLMIAELSKRYRSPSSYPFVRKLFERIRKSRRSLSLFQHHDGITGTSKDHVMADYAAKLYDGLQDCNHVIQQSLHVLTHLETATSFENLPPDAIYSQSALIKEAYAEVPHLEQITITKDINEKIVRVFNPTVNKKVQLVRLAVSNTDIYVTDLQGNVIDSELMPVFEAGATIRSNSYELNFVAEVDPLSVQLYGLHYQTKHGELTKPKLTIANSPEPVVAHNYFDVRSGSSTESFKLSNGLLTVAFDSNGLMSSVTMNEKEHAAQMSFIQYGAAKRNSETSGLYLFIPDGDATPIPVVRPLYKIVKGKFLSYVEVSLPNVKQRLTIFNYPGLERSVIEVKNLVDIRQERNYELAMKISTRIQSNNQFYTDLNGFQIIRRKWYKKLPLQANYYPIPTSIYIEDSDSRFNVLSAQPSGGSSMREGEIEIMLDRRLMQDDNRGAGQGCTDNVETLNVYKLIFEQKSCEDNSAQEVPPMLSMPAQIVLENLQNPLQVFISPDTGFKDESSELSGYRPLAGRSLLPCDVQLVGTFPLPEYLNSLDDGSFSVTNNVATIFRRIGFDSRYRDSTLTLHCNTDDDTLGRINFKSIFGDLIDPKIQQTTLSFLMEGKQLLNNDTISMKPMELYGFTLAFQVKK